MRRFRVSIASLLAGIALFGVAFTALIYPSPLAGNASYSLTLGTLMAGILGLIYRRGRRRAFWVGFAAFGWAYFLAIFGPDPISRVERDLLPEAILDILYPYTIPGPNSAAVPPPPPVPSLPPAPPQITRKIQGKTSSAGDGKVILVGAFGGGGQLNVPKTPWEIWTTPHRYTWISNQSSPATYLRIGHSMFCLLFALIGGLLARRFHEDRERIGSEITPATPG